MKHVHAHLAASLLAAVLVGTACGSDGARDDSMPPPDAAPVDANAPGIAAPGTAGQVGSGHFTVTISEGPYAGTHEATGEVSCFAQDAIWGANLTLDTERGMHEAYAMLQGMAADGGSTQQVEFAVTFHEAPDGSAETGMIGIGGAAGGGNGTGTVERDGERATIRIEGTAVTQSPVTAVFRCSSIDFAGS